MGSADESRTSSDRREAVVRTARRSVLADDVYEILRESLRVGRIAPGERLNLDQLARELHVSNTPVRQALARLESDGLVTKEAYRGFRASPLLDSRTIADLYGFRLLIEPPTAARAARRRSPEMIKDLDALCDENEVGRLIAQDITDALANRDIEFHTMIAREAGNEVVLDHLVATLTQMCLYSVYHRHGTAEQAWDEHRAILGALHDGDPDAAALAMRAHLEGSLRRVLGATAQ